MPQRASRPRGFAPTFGETEGNGLPEPGDFGDFPLELIDVPLEDDFVDTFFDAIFGNLVFFFGGITC
jgi:hypothetical protein